MSSLVLDSDWNPVASVVIQQYKDSINITYPTEPVTKDKAICGPKSWKENKENMEIDEELTDIYEGFDGDIPEAFGRISPITLSTNSQSPCDTPVDFGPFPINNNTTPFNLSLNYNEYIERNTIRIPNIGPGKPTRLSFGHTDNMELCFNPSGPENIKYASYLIALSNYEQILDEKKDLEPLLKTKKIVEDYIKKYPDTDYSLDLKFKLGLIQNQLAAKEIYIAKYYIKTQKWIPAINRLKIVVSDYEETIFVEEALHRLVEIYYNLGLVGEAKKTAKILGYNYNSSKWYENSYALLKKDYQLEQKKLEKKLKKNEGGLVKKTIDKILNK